MSLLLIIRYVLSTENKRRDEEQQLDNNYDDVYIERMGKDGQVERVKVDKVKKIFFFFVFRMFDANKLTLISFLCLGILGSYGYPKS